MNRYIPSGYEQSKKRFSLWEKFLAKREEKKDFEKFLCTIKDPTPCKKIPLWGFIVSFIKDLFPKRIAKVDKSYSWKDYLEGKEVKIEK